MGITSGSYVMPRTTPTLNFANITRAFALALEAGRAGYEAGLMPPRDLASPSTPVVGTPFWHAAS